MATNLFERRKLTKEDILKATTVRCPNLNQAQVTEAFDGLVEAIVFALLRGHDIEMRDFLLFKQGIHKGRTVKLSSVPVEYPDQRKVRILLSHKVRKELSVTPV